MTSDDIKTIEDLAKYIDEYKDHIYVREQVDGKWGAFLLSELPAPLAISRSLKFIIEGIIPVRLLTDEEIAENEAAESSSRGSEGE